MVETLQGLEGTEVYMDDISVHFETEEIHDRLLEQVLKAHIELILSHVPATPQRVQKIRNHTAEDPSSR